MICTESFLGQLQQAAQGLGLADNPDFSEMLQAKAVNWVLCDRRAGLVARVRPAADKSPEAVQTNLDWVVAATKAGAPLVGPVIDKVAVFGQGQDRLTATFWPLGDNRLITPQEMVEVLYQIHDTTPPPGLGDWIDVRHGNFGAKLSQLEQLPQPLPAEVMAGCRRLVDQVMARLKQLLEGAEAILLHGDSHALNFIRLDGRLLACDLDEICIGPAEADLSLPIVHAEKYPGADPQMGDNLLAAWGRPINHKLLRAMVDARVVSKLVNCGSTGGQPHFRQAVIERLKAVEEGRRFPSLHGEESVTAFAV